MSGYGNGRRAPPIFLPLKPSPISQIMDDRWEAEVIEFGAINITGFRIVDTNRKHVRDFLEVWKKLDPVISLGAGRDSISVSIPSTGRFCVCETLNRISYSDGLCFGMVGSNDRKKNSGYRLYMLYRLCRIEIIRLYIICRDRCSFKQIINQIILELFPW